MGDWGGRERERERGMGDWGGREREEIEIGNRERRQRERR